MPVKIISQKDLADYSLRGDEREETGYYKNNYYPNGTPRPVTLRGTEARLPHAERRETALDIAVRELNLQSDNIKSTDGNYIRPRNDRINRRDASASKDVKKVHNGSAEIYGPELPPLKQSDVSSVKTGSSNGQNSANPWRRLKTEKPKPERLAPDVLDSVKASKSTAKDPETGDSSPGNGAKEAVSESSETTTEPTTESTTESTSETTTETTESEKSESAPTTESGNATDTPVLPPLNSAKDENSTPVTENQKSESESSTAAKAKAPKAPVIPPPFYKSMIHPIKAEDGKIVPLIDIGASLTRPCYKNRMGSILERAKAAGVTTILITGTSYGHSLDAIRLCQEWDEYQGVKLRATVGLHPHEVMGVKSGKWSEKWCDSLERLVGANREYVVAVGECGLDYHGEKFNSKYDPPEQKKAFDQQLKLADKLNLPVFAHCRGAHRDFVNIAAPWMKKARPVRLVVHCHTDPDPKHLKEFLDAGAWIGLTGIITDKREGRFNEAIINQVPWERLMIETDSPFLLPSNACAIRDIDREWVNEPCLLPFVAEKIAQVDTDKTPAAVVAAYTTKNAIKFFGLEDLEIQA